MKWAVGLAVRIGPLRIMGMMGGCIPSGMGEIEASAKSDRIVDHDDFLMVGGSDGMCAVEPKVESSLFPEINPKERLRYPLKRVKDGEVPVEHVDVKIAPPFQKSAEEISEPIWKSGTISILSIASEQNMAVNIPAEDEDGPLSLEGSLLERFEIGFAIRQERHSVGPGSLPAISPLNKKGFLMRHFDRLHLIPPG